MQDFRYVFRHFLCFLRVDSLRRDRQRDQRLQQTLDKINSSHGKRTIGFTPNIPTDKAAELYDVGAKSPAYTTRIQDIIKLKC